MEGGGQGCWGSLQTTGGSRRRCIPEGTRGGGVMSQRDVALHRAGWESRSVAHCLPNLGLSVVVGTRGCRMLLHRLQTEGAGPRLDLSSALCLHMVHVCTAQDPVHEGSGPQAPAAAKGGLSLPGRCPWFLIARSPSCSLLAPLAHRAGSASPPSAAANSGGDAENGKSRNQFLVGTSQRLSQLFLPWQGEVPPA